MSEILEHNYEKVQLLDILSYVLWSENAKDVFGPSSAMFCTELYKDIVAEMKERAAKIQASSQSFESIDLKCRHLGEVYALEKRLELIEDTITHS